MIARISPAAANDLLVIADYLDFNTTPGTLSKTFLKTAATTIAQLENHSDLGRLRITSNRRLQNLRSLSLDPPFSKYLFFYQEETQGILPLRVLHGAQNLKQIFGVIS
jgi:plasmid stabilization system protein ParE